MGKIVVPDNWEIEGEVEGVGTIFNTPEGKVTLGISLNLEKKRKSVSAKKRLSVSAIKCLDEEAMKRLGVSIVDLDFAEFTELGPDYSHY